MQGQRILLIEDEEQIAAFITPYLKANGFIVHHAPTLIQARELMNNGNHSLIILDLMLPDGDGALFCRELRTRDDMTPVIMLTARDEDLDKIAGLDAGADDYITKPFNPDILMARVRSLLRRATRKTTGTDLLQAGKIEVDGKGRSVRLDGKEVNFAPKEFDLLWELMNADGRVISRKELLERVWMYTYHGDTRTVDVHVRGIRRKLKDNDLIGTVWGKGYKINVPVIRHEQ